MTNDQEREFRAYLSSVSYKGTPLTVAGINTRVMRVKQAEKILKTEVETIVSTDKCMRQELEKLRESDDHGGYANAIRKYYEMRHGKQYPRGKSTKNPNKDYKGEVKVGKTVSFSEVLKKFHQWLIDEHNLKKTSADQYKTYINNLCKEVDKIVGSGWFESLHTDSDNDSLKKRYQCLAYVEYMVRNASGPARKNWSDWRSAFYRFEDFLEDIADVWNGELEVAWKTKKSDKKVPIVPSGVKSTARAYAKAVSDDGKVVISTYTHDELVRKFIGRLKTQSRYYPRLSLLFPTRLITKIFSKKRPNEWLKWMKDDIEEMHIITSGDGAYVCLKAVKSMSICADGTVCVTTRCGGKLRMMTRTAGGGIRCEVAARGMRDISIDHVKALENVLSEKRDELKGLKWLTECFDEYKCERGVELDERAEREWRDDFLGWLKGKGFDMGKIVDGIVDDLKILKMEYELMDTHENSKKGKRK